MGANDIRMGIMAYDEYEDESGIDHKGACYKHCGSTRLEGDGKGSSTAVNVKVIRLSEVYLMAAECALKTNDKTAAKDYLNAISKRDLTMRQQLQRMPSSLREEKSSLQRVHSSLNSAV